MKTEKHILKFVFLTVVLSFFTAGCHHDAKVQERPLIKTTDFVSKEPERFDLDAIKKRGKLIALTLNSSTSYFVYRGQPMGYEYELLKRFTDHIGVDREVKIIPDVNAMFDLLNNGEGDIIACNLAITKKRLEHAAFSDPYNFTRQVLVQRMPEGWEKMKNKEIATKLVVT